MTHDATRGIEILRKAGYALLALQIGIFAKMWFTLGFDRATDNFPILVLCSGIFMAHLRRLSAYPPNPGAARWIHASHIAGLSLLAVGTLLLGYSRLVPQGPRLPILALQGIFALVWVIIALKGAAMGKLRPGSAMGLCVRWTRQSRLAWDRGHRTLGRVLFWGGLIGLTTCLSVDPHITLAMWFITVTLAVMLALFVSWRVWRLDPQRGSGHAA